MQIFRQPILIISPSSRLRSSLRVLLKSISPETQIEEFTDPDLAGQYMLDDPSCLVLLDADLPQTTSFAVPIENRRHYVMLAHSVEQLTRAKQAGFKALLLDGFSPEMLFTQINRE